MAPNDLQGVGSPGPGAEFGVAEAPVGPGLSGGPSGT
eukprot:CAMPEP_0184300496 /NCGR_PEP_ID=MMETSP1049-20130417/10894_1 /TAXON_ID=77928 /ORGANISM="Proteomonas sulcata, Strain CCMP704" /LENGTH=36 /DNA_ID= /DNA_START= /DNA_END= /DNA_ORIENTATION=